MSSTHRDLNHARAYREPPALTRFGTATARRHGPSPPEQQRNRKPLLMAQHTPRPRSLRSTETLSATSG